MEHIFKPSHFHDLGKLSLAFVMLWAYFNFSQYAGIRREPGRGDSLLHHTNQPRMAVPGAVPRGVPVCRSVSAATDARPQAHAPPARLGGAGAPRAQYVDLFMLVSPEFASTGANLHLLEGEHESTFFVNWLDLMAPLAIGGLWLWMFLTQLAQRPLLALGDPHLREALETTGGH